MKLILYIGLMVLAYIASLRLGQYMLKKDHLGKSILFSVLLNSVILGSGCMWWFLTETDGISQMLGVIYYGVALIVISVINVMVLCRSKKKLA